MALTTIQARSSDLDERFGYETSGSFHCPYSMEKFYIGLLVFLAIGGCVGIDLVLIASFPPDSEVLMFLSLALLAGFAIWLLICFIALRLIMKGSEYYYKADESKLTIFHGSQTQDFFYMNIMNVRYEPLMFLKWQRGFVVTVVTRKGTHTFKYIYDNLHAHMVPENTPFYILEDRAELRKETDPDLYFRHMREHQTEREEVIESGKAERPVKYDERLHPANVEIKPVDEEKFIIAKGTFSTPHHLDKFMLAIVAVICLTSLGIVFIELSRNTSMLSMDLLFNLIYGLLGVLIVTVILIGIYRVLSYSEYRYEADSVEFRITDPKGSCDAIYYKDVTEVKYLPLKLFGTQRGYKVEIITKYRTITYNWLFLKNRKFQKTSETPFKIIEDHITK